MTAVLLPIDGPPLPAGVIPWRSWRVRCDVCAAVSPGPGTASAGDAHRGAGVDGWSIELTAAAVRDLCPSCGEARLAGAIARHPAGKARR